MSVLHLNNSNLEVYELWAVFLLKPRCGVPNWEGWEEVAEKAMAPHSSTLAWKFPWTGEPGRLQSMGLQRVRHDWATSLSFFTFMHWRRKWQPLQCSCLENPRDGGAWWAAVYGVAQSRTRLKQLSSSREEVEEVNHSSELKLLCSLTSVRGFGDGFAGDEKILQSLWSRPRA